MGQMFLYDLYQARHSMEEFDKYTLDEIDRTFEMMTQLKYNQTVNLKGKGEGISITPLPAGHMIGGSIWKIVVKDGEEDIVYAVDYNHKRERHLNGAEIEKIIRPSLLITDSFNSQLKQIRRRTRDEKLLNEIMRTMRNGGNVLIAVDTAGRVLELAYMLDQLWQNRESGLLVYSLAMLNNVSYNVVEFAKSQIEWMSEKLMRTIEGRRNNPFQFRHLKGCHNLREVNKVPSPKVVLASTNDMESGFSRELFAEWAGNPRNSVILTSRGSKGTLAYDLINRGGNDRVIQLDMHKRVKLTGLELEEYRRQQREEKAKAKQASSVNDGVLIMEDDESSDEEMETLVTSNKKGGKGGKDTKLVKHDIIMKNSTSTQDAAIGLILGTQKQSCFKSTKSKYPMFPFHEVKIKWDDYGEIIRPEDWIDPVADQKADFHRDGENASGLLIQEDPLNSKDNSAEDMEIPTKCVTTPIRLQIRAQIQYIDFEGRSDGESIHKCLMQMKPRRVIIVRGSTENGKALADFCVPLLAKVANDDRGSDKNSSKAIQRVFMPKNGETIDATTESYIYQVRLPDSLMSGLVFQNGKDNTQLAWVDGRIRKRKQAELNLDITETQKAALNESNGKEVKLYLDVDNKARDSSDDLEHDKRSIPTLEPIEEEELKGHQTSFINELKLSDFKIVLSKHNVPSEFQGGVLFCGSNNMVALRRHDSGHVTVEGCVCEDYYLVRSLLYERYAIV
jgi:cleavage and polyadenylation specificity factor subunit 2